MIEPTRLLRPAIAAALLLGACGGENAAGPGPDGTLVIDSSGGRVEVAVEIADEPPERERGLMGRERLDPDAGMVFLHEEPKTSGFWMKNTLIPLSVAFWDARNRIIGIVDMEPCKAEPCPIYDAPGPWVGAVEVNQGFFSEKGVSVSDRVRLER